MNGSMLEDVFAGRRSFWGRRRELSLNWLALGLLLAAWNAAGHDAANPRPESLRGYRCVSVRAVYRLGDG